MLNFTLNISFLRQLIKNRIFFFVSSLAFGLLLTWNMYLLHSPFVGIISFLIYSCLIGHRVGSLLIKIIPLDSALKGLFGLLFWIYFLAFYGAIWVIFFKLYIGAIAGIILATPFIIALFTLNTRKELTTEFENVEKISTSKSVETRFIRILQVCLPVLMGIAFFLLLQSRTDKFIFSPWEVVPKIFLFLVFLISFFVFVHIFRRIRGHVSLLFIVLLSILIHSYLPIVYEAGYGGDKWRHLGIERSISQGNVISPSLLDKPVAYTALGPVKVPTVLITGNKTSYANMWAITVILSKLFAIDVFWIDHLLVFVLWSIFIPLLFYQMGLFIRPSDKLFALILSATTLLFYLPQIVGSFTVPYSFGHIFFVFCLMILAGLVRFRVKRAGYLLLILTAMLYLNYILALVLWILLMLIFALQILLNKIRINKSLLFRIFATVLLTSLVVMSIPALDIAYGKIFNLNYEFKSDSITVPYVGQTLKDRTLNFIGFNSFVSLNSTNDNSGKGSYPSNSNQMQFFAIFAFAGLLVLGLITNRKNLINRTLVIFIGGFFLVLYINSNFFQNGPRPLSNRLDLDFYLFCLPAIAFGIEYMYTKVFKGKNASIQIIALLLSIILVLNYSTNPNERMVTMSEVHAMESVFSDMSKKNIISNYCVISDTWPLLAMQAVSANKIVGGGFPMYTDFAQPERVEIQQGLFTAPNKKYLKRAFTLTEAKTCYVVTEKRWTSDLLPLSRIMGPYKQKGDTFVFSVDRSTILK